jgi:DNA-directed RNA polymerase subunit RPC12/RpoP
VPERESSQQRPSLTQRIVMRLMPGRADEIERQSREWLIVCPNCGLQRSYWDIGGVRYSARSRGKHIGVHCPSCGKRAMHAVEHRPGTSSEEA